VLLQARRPAAARPRAAAARRRWRRATWAAAAAGLLWSLLWLLRLHYLCESGGWSKRACEHGVAIIPSSCLLCTQPGCPESRQNNKYSALLNFTAGTATCVPHPLLGTLYSHSRHAVVPHSRHRQHISCHMPTLHERCQVSKAMHHETSLNASLPYAGHTHAAPRCPPCQTRQCSSRTCPGRAG
jgi:hypothetical protein